MLPQKRGHNRVEDHHLYSLEEDVYPEEDKIEVYRVELFYRWKLEAYLHLDSRSRYLEKETMLQVSLVRKAFHAKNIEEKLRVCQAIHASLSFSLR